MSLLWLRGRTGERRPPTDAIRPVIVGLRSLAFAGPTLLRFNESKATTNGEVHSSSLKLVASARPSFKASGSVSQRLKADPPATCYAQKDKKGCLIFRQMPCAVNSHSRLTGANGIGRRVTNRWHVGQGRKPVAESAARKTTSPTHLS